MNDFDEKYNIVDENTPRHTLMSGHYKKSFAFYTLRERLPVTLTQVVDNLSKDKDQIAKEYGEKSREELKEILGNISELKYKLQTDKQLDKFTGNEPDRDLWNDFLNTLTEENNSYFTTCWLYAECHMYRQLKSFFEATTILKDFDYFRKQKENAFHTSTTIFASLVQNIRNEFEHTTNLGKLFMHLLKINLWGNRCDLSISEGKEIKPTEDPFSAVDALNDYILVDESENIWNCICLAKDKNNNKIIEFVNDNAGYEILTDFLVAEFLIERNLADKIRFNVKAIPWFISDVTPHDFHWTIQSLCNHELEILRELGNKWNDYFQSGKFVLEEINYFWTSPYEFYKMPEICEPLYKKLSEAYLVIFKGDLNYRKLIGDFTWDFTEDFKTCLRGFLPTNLCTLRTVKADLICGLREGLADKLFEKDPNWMITGEYGVIQFVAGKN